MSASAQAVSFAPPARPLADGDERLRRYLAWVPVTWLLGLNIILGMYLTVRLALARWPTDPLTNLIVGAWALASVAQATSVLYNWSLLDEGAGFLVGRVLSSTTLGWAIVGVALAAGQSWSLASPRMVRGIMTFGLHIAWMGPLVIALATVTGIEAVHLPTPVSMVLGRSDAVNFYAVATVFQKEESSFGLSRLVLFFPWSTALSLAGICIVLISACERDRLWRAAGVAGGIVGVALSFSRAGYAVLPVSLGVLFALRARSPLVVAGLGAACLLGLAVLFLDIDPVKVFQGMVTTMRESRAGSSQARDQIYEASWNGFLASPLFGWGWVGESIISQEEIRVGSHSTLYGTLYTGGLLTLGSLVLAAAATFLAVLARALAGRGGDDPAPAVATALMVALVMFAYGEALYSLVPPLLFVFLFVGGSLAAPASRGAAR